MARLKSTNNLLKAVGYEETMYEDWTDETFNLLTKISNEISGPVVGLTSVFEALNDHEVMSSIIMHFRVRPSPPYSELVMIGTLDHHLGMAQDQCRLISALLPGCQHRAVLCIQDRSFSDRVGESRSAGPF